jgi:ATP-dependent Clp protease ATP-binding subunit ClpC
MKQERFTEQAQEALAASQELVRHYHHSQWDVEHILLALLQQERGLVGDIMKELGVDVEAAKGELEAALGRTPKVTYDTGQIYATPRIANLIKAPAKKPTGSRTSSSAPSTFLSPSPARPGVRRRLS